MALRIGYTGDAKQFRSDVHIIEYFILGVFAVIFVKSINVKMWIGTVLTCVFGLLDETVKILLPTREFSYIDLMKDLLGAGIALALFWVLMCLVGNNYKSSIRCSNF